MADDCSGGLPCRVKTHLRASSQGAHIQHMTGAKGNVTSAANILRHSSTRMVDEPSPQQARAIDKILRLPQ